MPVTSSLCSTSPPECLKAFHCPKWGAVQSRFAMPNESPSQPHFYHRCHNSSMSPGFTHWVTITVLYLSVIQSCSVSQILLEDIMHPPLHTFLLSYCVLITSKKLHFGFLWNKNSFFSHIFPHVSLSTQDPTGILLLHKT